MTAWCRGWGTSDGTRSAARRSVEQREREVFSERKRALEEKEQRARAKKIPTVTEFVPRFIADHCRAYPATDRFHIFRHTFCAHLAMRGAPTKAIQELAGHADLTTTMRYMQLSPAARDGAISLREQGHASAGKNAALGEMLE